MACSIRLSRASQAPVCTPPDLRCEQRPCAGASYLWLPCILLHRSVLHHGRWLVRSVSRAPHRRLCVHLPICDVNKGRVPVPVTSGFRAYYFIDPYCITDDGLFDPSLARLKGACVYNSKLAHGTKIVTFRNPHTIHEYILAYAVAPVGSKSNFTLIDDQVMIVSIDIAMR